MTCLLLVEDHPILADAVCTQLQNLFSPLKCLIASTLAEGLQLYQQQSLIDLVILDLNLPDSQELATLEAFCQVRQSGPLLVFSSSSCTDLAQLCASNRVIFVPKSVASSNFMAAVLNALSDRSQSLVQERALAYELPHCHDMALLSSQQRLVLSQMARGSSSVELAKQLHISECTVRSHMHAIYQKLGVKNKSQASSRYWAWVNAQGQQQPTC